MFGRPSALISYLISFYTRSMFFPCDSHVKLPHRQLRNLIFIVQCWCQFSSVLFFLPWKGGTSYNNVFILRICCLSKLDWHSLPAKYFLSKYYDFLNFNFFFLVLIFKYTITMAYQLIKLFRRQDLGVAYECKYIFYFRKSTPGPLLKPRNMKASNFLFD